MNLERKHLVGYLTSGLTMIYGIHNTELIGVVGDSTIVLKYEDGKIREQHIQKSGYKPVLHQLEDLTKPITHKEETFVPIIKIADFLGIKYLRFELLENSVDFILHPIYRRENTKTKEPKKVRFWLNTFKTKSFNCTDSGLMRGYDQLGAFELLYSWHFDIHNLIGVGLAIDINSLNK